MNQEICLDLGQAHVLSHQVPDLAVGFSVFGVAVPQADDIFVKPNAQFGTADLVSNIELLPDDGEQELLPKLSCKSLPQSHDPCSPTAVVRIFPSGFHTLFEEVVGRLSRGVDGLWPRNVIVNPPKMLNGLGQHEAKSVLNEDV